ncbi:GALNT16 [Cervus elaphus hippelaphus]|uniref:GALNT16 n=1 Tax=Cervus elaphus hippelaphus TaxID=46360 RepID=A0A212CTC0_CEREH|nr:GALNT16 [Cervus elaphus hippelaphus]
MAICHFPALSTQGPGGLTWAISAASTSPGEDASLSVTGTPSRGFDEKAYLAAKQLKPGEDPYRQHAFNQLESDKLSPDRPIRDTRHYSVIDLLRG